MAEEIEKQRFRAKPNIAKSDILPNDLLIMEHAPGTLEDKDKSLTMQTAKDYILDSVTERISPATDNQLQNKDGKLYVPSAQIDLLNLIYPVGSLYWSTKSTNPSQLFGGTWTQIKDKFVLAAGDTYTAEATGGNASITLTESQLPSHSHSVGAHSHGLNGHTHSMSHTHGTDAQGIHKHGIRTLINGSKTGIDYMYPANNASGRCIVLNFSSTTSYEGYAEYGGNAVQLIQNAGSHSHTTNSQSTSTTGGASGNTANSTAFNSGTTGNGSSITILPPYVVKYCWERIA